MDDKELLKLSPEELVDLGICPTCFIRKHNGALYGDNKDKLIYEEKIILTAFDKYGTGAGYQKVMNLWGGRVANSLAKSISQNFTKSALIIWGTTAATYGASYGLGQINWGF